MIKDIIFDISNTANMTQETYRIPAFYLSALINGDYSGLNDAEIGDLNTWLERVQPGSAVCPESEPFFAHSNDVFGFIGADCYDVIFIKQ